MAGLWPVHSGHKTQRGYLFIELIILFFENKKKLKELEGNGN
jgi:hypothetical protein